MEMLQSKGTVLQLKVMILQSKDGTESMTLGTIEGWGL